MQKLNDLYRKNQVLTIAVGVFIGMIFKELFDGLNEIVFSLLTLIPTPLSNADGLLINAVIIPAILIAEKILLLLLILLIAIKLTKKEK